MGAITDTGARREASIIMKCPAPPSTPSMTSISQSSAVPGSRQPNGIIGRVSTAPTMAV